MARHHMADRFELDEVDIGYNLDELKRPQDFMQAATSNMDLVEKMEEVLNGWCKQIDQVGYNVVCFVNGLFEPNCYRRWLTPNLHNMRFAR